MRGTLEKGEIREWVVLENEGKQIFGILHRPITDEISPIVIIMHGFASSKLGSNRCYVTIAETLAKAGIAALRFDFRGAGDSEGVLSDFSFEDMVSDGVTVVNQVNFFDGIDPSRIALFGASLGGTIALFTAMRTQKIKTLALWAPVASGELWFRDFLKMHPDYASIDPAKMFSSYQGIKLHPAFREQFALMSVYKNIHQLKPLPILHMHGEKDEVITMAHQEAFCQTCQAHSYIQTEFVKFPEGQHSLGFSPHFLEVNEKTLSWFQSHL